MKKLTNINESINDIGFYLTFSKYGRHSFNPNSERNIGNSSRYQGSTFSETLSGIQSDKCKFKEYNFCDLKLSILVALGARSF